MATRFIEQGLDLEQQPLGSVAPFGVESDGVLRIDRGARFKGSLSAAPGPEVVQVNRKPVVLAATATSATATAADAGTLFVANTTVTVTLTLPLAATAGAGAEFGLAVGAVTSSGGHKITPQTGDKIFYDGAAAGSSVECSAASDVVGDFLVVRSDGGTSWWPVAKGGTWNDIA